jgi:hypothetical protein
MTDTATQPIRLATYETRPRQAIVSADPITPQNRDRFCEAPRVRMPLQHQDVVAVVVETLAGEVEVPFGQHLIFTTDEVYPITVDELAARYVLVTP